MSTLYNTQLFIDGKYVDPVRGGSFETVNPANCEVICKVSNGTAEDVNLAVEAARRAMNSDNWGYKSTGAQRAVILRKLGEIITRRKDELAMLDSLDHGKPLRESLADMGDAIACCEYFAELAEKQDTQQGEVIENGTNGDFVTKIRYEPIGVVGAITPWNYPFLMGIWKVVPAIAAGCAIVLKPSELAPLSCILFGELCNEAGLPAGALNVIPGLGVDAGGPLSHHDGVDKIAFTGSAPTARKIMAAAAMGPRAISLELGGKSPLIVFEDADIPSAVDWIITGILWGSGQVCSATSRVMIHSSIKQKVIDLLLERVAQIRIGDSLSTDLMNYQGPTMGPVINQAQYDRILAYIAAAEGLGIGLIHGGAVAQAELQTNEMTKGGLYIAPTIFVDVPGDCAIWKEEIFGPVLCIREFTSEEDVILMANETIYGLAAAVFSADEARCDRVCNAIRCGIVWKNCCQPAFIQAPWGGVKKSGFGRELGRWGLEEFSSVKQVTSCAPGFQWGLW